MTYRNTLSVVWKNHLSFFNIFQEEVKTDSIQHLHQRKANWWSRYCHFLLHLPPRLLIFSICSFLIYLFHSSSKFGEQNTPEWTIACGDAGDGLHKRLTWLATVYDILFLISEYGCVSLLGSGILSVCHLLQAVLATEKSLLPSISDLPGQTPSDRKIKQCGTDTVPYPYTLLSLATSGTKRQTDWPRQTKIYSYRQEDAHSQT